MFFDSKATMVVIASLFVLAISVVPMYASDTTTTEVGAQVEQVMQIAPAGNSEGGLDATGMAVDLNGVINDAISQSASTGDSLTMTIDPANSSSTTNAKATYGDIMAFNSNVDFDLYVEADTTVTAHSNGNLRYSGSESPSKPLGDLWFSVQGIGSYGSRTDFNSLIINNDGSPALINKSAIPAGEYTADGNGMTAKVGFLKTSPSNMPKGFYSANLIWTIEAAN